ncbi:MAG TPA: hypothetical protein VJZ50_07640 [Candidatus Limnocylindrales bacterium]|nr:hypothetical protein [Candidatus Limnocylindrales bacterium]
MFSRHTLMPSLVVSVDGQSGRPREIRVDGQRLAVTALDAIRDETAAYAPETGPRTVFLVRSHQRRYRLVHLLRERRWTIDELAPDGTGLSRAA